MPPLPAAVRHLGRGEVASVDEVIVDDTEWALKKFDSFSLFDVEREAYRLLVDAEPLRGRIPTFRYSYDNPPQPALLLQLLPGSTLRQSLPDMHPALRRSIREQICTTLSLLHEAGLCHGDVTSTNIMVHHEHAWLLGFSHARREFRSTPEMWEERKHQDKRELERIFEDFAAVEAHDLLDQMDTREPHPPHQRKPIPQQGEPDPDPQQQLATLLADIPQPDNDLLTKFLARVAEPSADLALVLADRLNLRHYDDDAIKVVLNAINRREAAQPSSPLLSAGAAEQLPGDETLRDLKIAAARHTGCLENCQGLPESPSAQSLYEAAVAFVVERHGCRKTEVDVLELRWELADHLRCQVEPEGAMAVCLDVLDDCRGIELSDEEKGAVEEFEKLARENLLAKVKSDGLRIRAEEALDLWEARVKREEETLSLWKVGMAGRGE